MKKRILYLSLFIVIATLIFIAWELVGPATGFKRDKYFLFIRTGMNFPELMDLLRKDTVITNPSVFRWVANRMEYPEHMKAGRYEIRSGMNLLAMLHMLDKGRQSPVNLVITKLRTKEDLASLIGRKLECDSSAFMGFLNNSDSLKEYRLDTNTVMTAIFPNTYSYFWNTTSEKVFKKLFANYKNYWTPERLKMAKEHGLTPATAYTLASIVEEETNRREDKARVASVYLNRLHKGMKLAADPTIKFALHNFELKRIYEKYLQVESPYNTYKYAGLPPGPICTPAPETLESVLNAPETNYLYFVAKPDFSGYSNFSETFEQHLQYAKAYQKSLDEQMKIGAAEKKDTGR